MEDCKDNKKLKGAEFMALRQNVRIKRREIRRALQPLENYLLDDIAEGTINDWNSKGEFDLKELAESLHTRVNRIYTMLANLESLGIITREPTRYLGKEIIGLNANFFGQILTDHQHNLEKKRHLKLVDNSPESSPNRDQSSPNRDKLNPETDQSSPNRDKNDFEYREIIEKNPPIDSFRSNSNFFRGKPGESLTQKEWNREPTQDDLQREKQRQLRMFAEMEKKRVAQ